MNASAKITIIVLLLGVISLFPLDAKCEEKASPSAGFGNEMMSPPPLNRAERKTPLRESEILGTLEKPQLSTDLPWKSPEGLDLNLSRPHRSFIKEIFRPVNPEPEPHKKNESK